MTLEFSQKSAMLYFYILHQEAVFHGILLGFKYMGEDMGYNGGSVINVASMAGEKKLRDHTKFLCSGIRSRGF